MVLRRAANVVGDTIDVNTGSSLYSRIGITHMSTAYLRMIAGRTVVMRAASRWVVQQVAQIPVKSFHVLDDADRLRVEPFYIVVGFAPSRDGVALVARASQRPVVNIAKQGGMCAVMVSAKALDSTPGH